MFVCVVDVIFVDIDVEICFVIVCVFLFEFV